MEDRSEEGLLRAYLVTLSEDGMCPEIETYVQEDYHNDKDFPYGESVLTCVGSNQTIIVEDMDQWDDVMKLIEDQR